MALGLRVRNANGFVQIDGNYRNSALVAKYTVNPSAASNANGMYITDLTIPYGIYPVLVGHTPGGSNSMAFSLLSRTGNSWTYRILTTTRAAIEVYHFDNMSIAKITGTVGIRVRNATTGEVVFDSRCKYMRIIDTNYGVGNNHVAVDRTYGIAKVGIMQAMRFMTSPSEALPGNPPLILATIIQSVFSASGGRAWTGTAPVIVLGPAQNVSAFNFENWSWGYLMLDLSNFD